MNSKVALAIISCAVVVVVFLGEVDLVTSAADPCDFDRLNPCKNTVERNLTNPPPKCCEELKKQKKEMCLCQYINDKINKTIMDFVKMAGNTLCTKCGTNPPKCN
ncbi:hypothetical protein PHJA_000614700 [Phtheirospermum japonicum]|uniref:Bifunctional inhibitor/plant lipid transfer protein/seed storage helical domain-containing protein n=1 Tax=Phtheirospermum japonicum TaxID=374723 RepID=A0A830BHW2_9LAMI|nr:hypothetical protein PHJA_000614700 [Phtheirospermum japonicum]